MYSTGQTADSQFYSDGNFTIIAGAYCIPVAYELGDDVKYLRIALSCQHGEETPELNDLRCAALDLTQPIPCPSSD